MERKINSLKVFSQSRKTARRQLLLQRRKAQMRKLSQHEEDSKSEEPPKYRKDSLRGLVTQVPESTSTHVLLQNPYSPRSHNYYLSEVVKHYKDSKSAAREHLATSIQILKTLENSKMPTK